MSECTHKTMAKQNMRENRASDRWNLKSQCERVSNRELKSQLSKLVLSCSRVACMRLKEH